MKRLLFYGFFVLLSLLVTLWTLSFTPLAYVIGVAVIAAAVFCWSYFLLYIPKERRRE